MRACGRLMVGWNNAAVGPLTFFWLWGEGRILEGQKVNQKDNGITTEFGKSNLVKSRLGLRGGGSNA